MRSIFKLGARGFVVIALLTAGGTAVAAGVLLPDSAGVRSSVASISLNDQDSVAGDDVEHRVLAGALRGRREVERLDLVVAPARRDPHLDATAVTRADTYTGVVTRLVGLPETFDRERRRSGRDQESAFGLDQALVAVRAVAVGDVVGHRLGERVPVGVVGVVDDKLADRPQK